MTNCNWHSDTEHLLYKEAQSTIGELAEKFPDTPNIAEIQAFLRDWLVRCEVKA